ncbi:MAG: phage virion morphogenesis protein [Bacteroides sp.]|nr:phage virion morphogenesis protein [Bacteroides sp.]
MKLEELTEQLEVDMMDVAQIAAATGVSVFKQAFRDKSFNGKPWLPVKVEPGTGSLMLRSGALMNSVRTASITEQGVTFTAGNDRVPYAQVHNEGGRAGRGMGFFMPQRKFLGDIKSFD